MELCEGMYVRTKYGITQYKEYETNKGKLLCMPLKNGTFANIEDVLKASKNIIDLIEVGDYVNGYRVLGTNLKLLWWDDELGEQDENEGIELEGYGYIYPNSNYHFEINSIVTKEAFSSVEYRVEND